MIPLPAILFLLLQAGAPSHAAAPEDLQQEAMRLWIAGDFKKAAAAGVEMTRRFPSHPRGKTAWFHIGNQWENIAAAEARDTEELRVVLEKALEAFGRSKAAAEAGTAAMRLTDEGLERVRAKLMRLNEIHAGRMDEIAASEFLSDAEASRAAATYLEARLRPGDPGNHHRIFLILVHQSHYVDGLVFRLSEGIKALQGSRPDLLASLRGKYAPLLRAEIPRTRVLAARAAAEYPKSPHILDYLVYAGEAANAEALLAVAELDILPGREESPDAPPLLRSALAALEDSRKADREIVSRCREGAAFRLAMAARTWLDPREGVHLARKHMGFAKERLAGTAAVAAPFRAALARRAFQPADGAETEN